MVSHITLKKFMIFNSSEGCQESQEKDKLLYHWTKDAPDNKISINEQIDDVCLCDASVNVSVRLNCDVNQLNSSPSVDDLSTNKSSTNGSFKPNENGKSLVLTFEKTVISIIEVEPNQSIWMATHVGQPEAPFNNENSSQSQQQAHFDPNCVPTDAIERVMNNIYARFCLLNGNFQMIADEELKSLDGELSDGGKRSAVREKIRNICDNYFQNVLPDIHLNSIISNITSLYNYILYLDLNPITLMKLNSFINHMVCIDPLSIRHTIVIFNDQLLWSSLNMYDTRLLYNFLVSVLIRDALQEELSKEVDKVRQIKENMPIYLTDCFTADDCSESRLQQSTIVQMYSNTSENQSPSRSGRKLNRLYLTVFRSSNNMTLGLILNEPNLTDLLQRCEQILTNDSRLGVIPLASLAQSVGQNFLRANSLGTSLSASSSSTAHAANPTPTMYQQSSSSSVASNSIAGGWKNTHANVAGIAKSSMAIDQKYISIDKLDVSISWPMNMDLQNNKEHLLSNIDTSGSYSTDLHPLNRKQRLIRYLIELEPELRDMKQSSGGCLIEEFFGKTLSDSWLTITNSKYKTIYSIHNMRNSGLTEAQQSAINLKSILAGNKL